MWPWPKRKPIMQPAPVVEQAPEHPYVWQGETLLASFIIADTQVLLCSSPHPEQHFEIIVPPAPGELSLSFGGHHNMSLRYTLIQDALSNRLGIDTPGGPLRMTDDANKTANSIHLFESDIPFLGDKAREKLECCLGELADQYPHIAPLLETEQLQNQARDDQFQAKFLRARMQPIAKDVAKHLVQEGIVALSPEQETALVEHLVQKEWERKEQKGSSI